MCAEGVSDTDTDHAKRRNVVESERPVAPDRRPQKVAIITAVVCDVGVVIYEFLQLLGYDHWVNSIGRAGLFVEPLHPGIVSAA